MCADRELVESCAHMYESIALAKALDTLFRNSQGGFDELEIPQADTITPEQLFHSFINKLAQGCDSEPGGRTVTGLAVVKGAEGPIYVMASNSRTPTEYQDAIGFLGDILGFVEKESGRSSKKSIIKQVLWKILKFGVQRVNLYLRKLELSLDSCIEVCERKEPNFPELKEGLEKLRAKADFKRDLVSEANSEPKFLSDCETLIKALQANKDLPLEQAVKRRAKEIDCPNRDDWRAVWHYGRRLLSYRQAAETIVKAQEQWPELFKGFNMVKIASSKKILRPIPEDWHPLTAVNIFDGMELELERSEHYESLLQEWPMQSNHLDEEIEKVVTTGFQPYVHAEVLVHNRLRHLEPNFPHLYWNDWKYIGCSKPLCRLCTYYFNYFEEKECSVKVRNGHHNIYKAWRLPYVPQDTEREVDDRQQHQKLQRYITERVRENIIHTLDKRCTRGRRYDSNSYTLTLHGPRSNDSSSVTSTTTNRSFTSPPPPPYEGRAGSGNEDSEGNTTPE